MLCRRKNGAVLARDTGCRKRETEIDPVAVGIRAALATGHILANGTLDALNASGLMAENVTSPGPGRYCFQGLPFTVKNVSVTLDASDGISPVVHMFAAWVQLGALGCPQGTQVSVLTADATGVSPAGFFIAFN
jgi:hypothetical protein